MNKTRRFKIVVVSSAFLFALFVTSAQSPSLPYTIGWQKMYGGSADEENDYKGTTIALSSDGGYFFIANTKSNDGDVSGNHGKFDVWVVKIDASGNIKWQSCIGGNEDDDGMFVLATSDAGCLVGGETPYNNGDSKGNHGNSDGFICKFNANGIVEWKKNFGSNKDDGFTDAIQNPDGSY